MSVIKHESTALAGVNLTQVATDHIVEFLSATPANIGIRFSIKKTGCSGYAYKVDPVQELVSTDMHWPLNSTYTIYIDKASYPYLKGMTVDYVKQGLNKKFTFTNPNQTGQCGCGESFTVS